MPNARGVNQGLLNNFRTSTNILMLNSKCDLLTPTHSQNDTGDDIISWAVQAGDLQVPCRIENIQFRAAQLEQYAGKQIVTLLYKAYFTWDSTVTVEKHVLYQGVEYRVRVLNKKLTDNVYTIAHLSTVD